MPADEPDIDPDPPGPPPPFEPGPLPREPAPSMEPLQPVASMALISAAEIADRATRDETDAR